MLGLAAKDRMERKTEAWDGLFSLRALRLKDSEKKGAGLEGRWRVG